jgi:hypothetical protein
MNAGIACREQSAQARDARDIARITLLHDAAHACLCRVACIDALEHPDSRFHPDDLRLALRGVIQDLSAELIRITTAQVQVLDDPDITADVREFADG